MSSKQVMGGLEEALGSWLQIGSGLASAALWGGD